METRQVHAVTPALEHGHVMSIERRLSPWEIEVRTIEHPGSVEWHLASSVESEREMLRHLGQAVQRETGTDSVRRETDEDQPDVAELAPAPDSPPDMPVIL